MHGYYTHAHAYFPRFFIRSSNEISAGGEGDERWSMDGRDGIEYVDIGEDAGMDGVCIGAYDGVCSGAYAEDAECRGAEGRGKDGVDDNSESADSDPDSLDVEGRSEDGIFSGAGRGGRLRATRGVADD